MSKNKQVKKVEDASGYQVVEKEVTFVCPTRGKVTQLIKVKVYAIGGVPTRQTCH
jgi:hypothetical protein